MGGGGTNATVGGDRQEYLTGWLSLKLVLVSLDLFGDGMFERTTDILILGALKLH